MIHKINVKCDIKNIKYQGRDRKYVELDGVFELKSVSI